MNTRVSLLSNAGGRKENEDYCGYHETDLYGCYILADGLGGHRNGAIASKTVGKAVINDFINDPGASQEILTRYLLNAKQEMSKVGSQINSAGGMKTTVVVVLTDFNYLYWVHVGDSRMYLFNSGKLFSRTKDHSIPQLLADTGEISEGEIRSHEDRNRLTAVFGSEGEDRFSYNDDPYKLLSGDVILLCSDGFWEYVLESEMENDLVGASSPEVWLGDMEKRLLERAISGHDNYSALAVMFDT